MQRIFALVILSLFFAASLIAQSTSSVDLTFDAPAARNQVITSVAGGKIVLQPDGTILVFGNLNNIRDKSTIKLARLNQDGTTDTSFSCICDNFTVIGSVAVQPDGKIIVAGNLGSPRLVRLNTDGSLDSSFRPTFDQLVADTNVYAVQPDGKILATVRKGGAIPIISLERFNSDGSLDSSFSGVGFTNNQGNFHSVKVLPDGKIMVSGIHPNYGRFYRLNSNGLQDTSFIPPVFTSPGNPAVADFGVQSDGKIVITGSFVRVNNVIRDNFARLNADGSLDLKFTSPVHTGSSLAILSNDKILIDGNLRLNADGTADNTFSAAYPITSWQLDSLERIVFAHSFTESGETNQRVGRMNADGSSDGAFNFAPFGLRGEVTALAAQPDGKIIVAGFYNRINGVLRKGIARINADGTVDTTFDAGDAVAQGSVTSRTIIVQPDGKILLGKIRLNPDGSLDSSFNPVVDPSINVVALQTDGKILIGGTFNTVNGASRTRIARLNADGTLDTTFNPVFENVVISSLFAQADGKIMVGGFFTKVNGVNRSNLARLNSDGTLDTGFDAGTLGQNFIQIAQYSNGKYLVGNGGGVISRINADGTPDNSFHTVFAVLKRFVIQSNGNIVIVGDFGNINGTPRNNIARVNADGDVDFFFFVKGSNGRINDIVEQADGKMIVGGDFTIFEKTPRSSMARLTLAPFVRSTLFDYDGDGKADISVFRPSENKWYVLRSSDSGVTQQVFATGGDKPVPADYDGDGKTDFAIFRPSSNQWWYSSSLTGGNSTVSFGRSGIIVLPADYDGDGRADYTYFLPGNSTWYRFVSVSSVSIVPFGLAGDKPVTGDFDGDGKTDIAIYRPSTGDWWWRSSIDNVGRATHWGIDTDVPVPGDYDGDGKTDFAVFRPSEGNWYIFNSSDFSYTIIHWGIAEDKPVAADYDGDGKTDIAVFRSSTGVWYLLRSTAGFLELPFGVSTDIPTPNSFVP